MQKQAKEKFSEMGGNKLKQGNRGEIRNLWRMTKKRSSEIFADENRKFWGEKVKLGKFSICESAKFFGNRRANLKQREEMHHCLRGDGRP